MYICEEKQLANVQWGLNLIVILKKILLPDIVLNRCGNRCGNM